MRNPEVPIVANRLREAGFVVYDDWFSPGPEADDHWQRYERSRGRSFAEALAGWHARHVFENDKQHLDEADLGVIVLPAGRSVHLEAGYLVGCGKPVRALLPKEPDRFDIMYRFLAGVFYSLEDLLNDIGA